MRDLKVIEWHNSCVRPEIKELDAALFDGTIKTPHVRGVGVVFLNNVHLVFKTSALLHTVFMGGKYFQLAETNALMQLYQKPFVDEDIDDAFLVMRVSKLRKQMLDGTVNMPCRHYLRADPRDALQDCEKMDMDGNIELLMSMQMTSAWTAFETLLGDLWEAALNVHPIGLSALKGTNRDSLRKLPIGLVEEKKFDLRNAMGTILRKNFMFSSLSEIRDAYKAAFHEQGMSICDAVDHDSFTAVNAIRNVIVHRAGVCDEDYKSKADRLSGLIPQLEIGSQLELDGTMISTTLVPALKTSIQLIRSVDAWIIGHPAYTLSSGCHEWTI